MEKNALIAIVLSLLVLILFQFFLPKPPPAPPEGPAVANAPAPEEKPAEAEKAPPPSGPRDATTAGEKDIRVETGLYSAVLSSRGGTLKSWQLKKHKDEQGLDASLLEGGGLIRALALGVGSDFSISEHNFKVTGRDIVLDDSRNTGSVTFSYRGAGYSIRRTFTFYHDSYRFDLVDEVTGLPEYQITLGADFGMLDRGAKFVHTGPVLLQDVAREEIKAGKLKAPRLFTGDLKWIALEDKYFFAAIVPATPMESAKVWKEQDSAAISFIGQPGVRKLLVYAGPKEHDRLKELGVGLEHIVDFGFFSIIARPIFWLLKKIYSVVGNYGWAIVVLTIVLRVPFIPIVNKGQKSMKKLQELQPRMQEVKEKYKNDPKRMQQEMMAMYKKYKVNPMGGCLPMLIQIPFFFALYKVLLIAIELRSAPWTLWIQDLSVKDPYYILPIVMGISMVAQQKMTPAAGDPRQRKMMMFMPVIFTFLFLNFASGLVLYWLVNNLLSIAQQLYVNMKKTE
jgi:YidC/Oxa1 family membrane protein insertase